MRLIVLGTRVFVDLPINRAEHSKDETQNDIGEGHRRQLYRLL